jgi:hypothetical protein
MFGEKLDDKVKTWFCLVSITTPLDSWVALIDSFTITWGAIMAMIVC